LQGLGRRGVDHLGPARPFFLRNYAVVANLMF